MNYVVCLAEHVINKWKHEFAQVPPHGYIQIYNHWTGLVDWPGELYCWTLNNVDWEISRKNNFCIKNFMALNFRGSFYPRNFFNG